VDFFIILPNFQRNFAKGGVFLTDQDYWKLALEPTCLGQNPVVKSVIVNQGPYGGLRAYLKAGEPHSEVHAIKMACSKSKGATIYVMLEPCSHYGKTLPYAGLQIFLIPCPHHSIPRRKRPKSTHVLSLLRQEGISSLLVEGGESIHASFIEDQLFQEIIAYIVPKWIGGTTAPSFLSS
jgi:deoxycytidylate deaminase